MSNPGLTDEELVELLNMARKTFSNDYIPLHDKKIAAIKKCADLVAIDPRSILRNVLKSRAHTILTDIWTYSHPEVFVLCSIATTITRLGGLKSTDYIRKLREWWDKADKPDGLRQTVKKLAKILPTKQDAAATFENAVSLAAESIPESKDREDWINSCLNHVHSLRLLSSISEDGGSGQKRKRTAGQEAGLDTLDGHNRLVRATSSESVESAAAINLQQGNASSLDSALFPVLDQRPSKRPRLASQQTPGLDFPGTSQYCKFSIMRRHMTENLPEPFRTGVRTSKLWSDESEEMKRGGLAITNGLCVYLPEIPNNDSFVIITVGYDEGFNVSNLFGLGDPKTVGG